MMQKQRYPDPPVTDIESVENSAHKHDLFVLLCSGWTAPRVAAEMDRRFGERIPVSDISTFAQAIPDQFVMALSQLQAKYAAIDVEVDTASEMHKMLLLARDRLDDALIHEQVTKQQGTGVGRSEVERQSGIVKDRAREYWKMLLDFVDRLPIMRDAELPVEAKRLMPAIDRPSLGQIIEARRLELLPQAAIATTTYRELPAMKTEDGTGE